MSRINYVYVDEDAIDERLKCPVCYKPFVDPVVTISGDRCCRLCIGGVIQDTDFTGSISNVLVQIDENFLRLMLDDLLVKCVDCNETNMRRRNFQEHLLQHCPKRIVLCKASDLKCPWSGPFDEADAHVRDCRFEYLRPALMRTGFGQDNREEYERIVQEQKIEIERLKLQNQDYEQRIQTLHDDLQASMDVNNQQSEVIRDYLAKEDHRQNVIEQLQEQYQLLYDRVEQTEQINAGIVQQNDQLNEAEKIRQQSEMNQLKEQYQQMNELVQEIQQSNADMANRNEQSIEAENTRRQMEIDQLKERYQELKNLLQQIQQSNADTANRNDQSNDAEKVRQQAEIKQLKEQHQQLNNLVQQLQQSNVNTANQNTQSKEFEQIRRQIEDNRQQNESNMKKYQEQYGKQVQQIQKEEGLRKNELLRLRQISDQHEIQIRLLARKKCVVPTRSTNISEVNGRLQEFLKSLSSNVDVNLDGKDHGNQDIEYICKVAIGEKRCRKLRLEGNNINGKGAAILADALYANNSLTELHLSNNSISDIGAHALAQVLSIHNWTLTWLEINANEITDDGAECLAEMLKVNKTLVLLGLSYNQISDRGVQCLAGAIGYFNETLQWLHLASNRNITDTSIGSFVDMFGHNRSLQAVYLNDCSFTSNGIKQLKKAVEMEKKTNFFLNI